MQWFSRQSSATDERLLKRVHVAPGLKSSLQKFFGRHDMLVDFTGIFILLRIFCLPFITYSVEYFVLLVCVLWFVSICACASELSILGRPYDFL